VTLGVLVIGLLVVSCLWILWPFLGAIGGLVSLGLIGLFVGPVMLAVTYRLLEWWIGDIDAPAAAGV
jgi:predicted PurR-regulated permease PerM